MSDKIRGIIQETNNGAYYNVLLSCVPQKGEFVSLYSFLDQSTGHTGKRKYEVVNVVHEISDVVESIEQSRVGSHSVTIFVKLSNKNHNV